MTEDKIIDALRHVDDPDLKKDLVTLNMIKDIQVDGNKVSYSTNISLSYIGTFIIGFFSNLIGIGGGIIHVPFLILFLRIPVHIALGTSHFILCVSSFVGMIMFMILGNIHIDYMMPIAVGAILGAKIGVELSKLTSPVVIRKMLALILL